MERVRRIQRPTGTFVVRRRRHGVEPSGGCLVGMLLWAFTRWEWGRVRDRSWALELSVAPPGRLGGFNTLIERTLWATQDEADRAAALLVERLERGELDDRLR